MAILTLSMSSALYALQTAPGPPYSNPHPPVTQKDKERVAFAELAVKALLMSPVVSKEKGTLLAHPNVFLGLSAACLQNTVCLSGQTQAIQQADAIKNAYGVIKEIRHAHIIPDSMEHFLKSQAAQIKTEKKNEAKTAGPSNSDEEPMTFPGMENAPPMALRGDEYTVHIYATPNGYEWYNLDAIIAEDKNGQMRFQRFYIFPMKSQPENLPPGAVC